MAEVIVRSRKGLTHDVEMGSHSLVADEPEDAGGADLGPNPYELLLAALGTCTAMTVRLYATRRQWPLEAVEVRLHHERLHAADCQDCDTQERSIERITKEVTLHGALDEAQRQRLLEISERCPVQRTLQRGVQIEHRVAPGD